MYLERSFCSFRGSFFYLGGSLCYIKDSFFYPEGSFCYLKDSFFSFRDSYFYLGGSFFPFPTRRLRLEGRVGQLMAVWITAFIFLSQHIPTSVLTTRLFSGILEVHRRVIVGVSFQTGRESARPAENCPVKLDGRYNGTKMDAKQPNTTRRGDAFGRARFWLAS